MGSQGSNPPLVTAFGSALMHQGLSALLVLAAVAVGWVVLNQWRPALARQDRLARRARQVARDSGAGREPAARRLLRLGFGLLWTLDGVLQVQPAMPAGLPAKVIAPAAATSPGWVRDLVGWGSAAWSAHPVQAAAAVVWIQAGIGIWLLAAARGPSSRLAGLAGAAWGLVVWVFGEALGGILAPGLTVLSGAPGAALCYVAAGVLIALPERSWCSAALGRRLLAILGTFLAAMAVLQAWPGRGFWQPAAHGGPGGLTAIVAAMRAMPQPPAVARLVGGFASLTASHGFGVNACAVAALAAIGVGLASRRREILLPVVLAAALFCLADWVLVQDLGVFGGLGTDPNSMLPLLLLIACGYLALARPVLPETALPDTQTAPAPPWRKRLGARRLARGFAAASAPGLLAAWAAALVLLGAGSMALAQASAGSPDGRAQAAAQALPAARSPH